MSSALRYHVLPMVIMLQKGQIVPDSAFQSKETGWFKIKPNILLKVVSTSE